MVGSLRLRQADRKIGLLRRVARYFTDYRQTERIEHRLKEMLAQRSFAHLQDPAAENAQNAPALAAKFPRERETGEDRRPPRARAADLPELARADAW